MQFLVKFCGYSAAESDTVRRGIAKKKGTEALLPEIERRFIEKCSKEYDLTVEKCESVIKPFLQVILDASAYAFSWNHSDSYSAIGYICGYLRYYHPLEFLTAALNIFGDNFDKTTEITKYANKVGIRVTMPKWGFSRSDYYYDKEANVIAKGLSSVKYMSSATADELYELAHKKQYNKFVDVLFEIDKESSINTRQLDILIKLDFFDAFGNQRELLRITELFYGMFKCGDVKKLRKELVDGTPLEPIVKKYSTGFTKSGGEAKSYTILDAVSILEEVEEAIKELHMEDLSDMTKVRNFVDVMGYVGYTSGKEEDRRKLYVLDVFPATRRKDGKKFGYNIVTRSIGSGKESRFTIFNKEYSKRPVHKDDIIYCKRYERNGKYYNLFDYDHVG